MMRASSSPIFRALTPGTREDHGGSREQRVAERVPNPAEPQLVAALALREHRNNLARSTLVSLRVVEPRACRVACTDHLSARSGRFKGPAQAARA